MNQQQIAYRFAGTLQLLWLFGVTVCAQAPAKVVREIHFPEQLQPSGQFEIMDDSIVLMPANGGVYNLTKGKWHINPDTQRVILSYVQKSAKTMGFMTAFVRSLQSTVLYKRNMVHDNVQLQRLSDVPPGGAYRVDICQNALFVYGEDKQGFHFFEYRADTLSPILETQKYLPAFASAINPNTLLFSVDNLLFSCARFGSIRKLTEFGEPISSFATTDDAGIVLATARGLFLLYAEKDPLVLQEGNFGEIKYCKGVLYCMNWGDRVCRLVTWDKL